MDTRDYVYMYKDEIDLLISCNTVVRSHEHGVANPNQIVYVVDDDGNIKNNGENS